MSDLDAARLERALDRHSDTKHYPDFDESCDRYCGPDIKRWYDDPTLMELTDAEEAAEAATWD